MQCLLFLWSCICAGQRPFFGRSRIRQYWLYIGSMTNSPNPIENIDGDSTWNQGPISHRKGSKLEPTIKTLPNAGVDTDNVDLTEVHETIVADAIQSASEFNLKYGKAQSKQFDAAFELCRDAYESDPSSYETWFKAFSAELDYPDFIKGVSTVDNFKKADKGFRAFKILSADEPRTETYEDKDGNEVSRTVDIGAIIKANPEVFTNREIRKSSGILDELVANLETNALKVADSLEGFTTQEDMTVIGRQSLAKVASAKKIKAPKSEGGRPKESEGAKLIKQFDRCSSIQRELFVQARKSELQLLMIELIDLL